MLLENKVVVVTGASRGIGRAIAVGCAEQGADVVINFEGVDGGADDVVAEIRALGRRALARQGDIADPATAKGLIDAAVKAFGGVDVCVANAGICPFHAFLDLPPEVLRRTMGVNFEGTFYVAQAAANRMKEQGRGGSIIAISSISKLVGGEFQSHYTPTKAAQHALMQSAAIALGRHGIRCNSVLPGTIATDLNRADLTPEKTAYFDKRIPLGRLGQPRDIAGPVIFLASDLAAYVTGAEVLVDGGLFVNLQ
ncbi:MAG TPA: SDR family NAD(P)-dependent oxidoreductase [Burkholderiaceae bacterium]|jgi:L-rhamnose 1-dehydrogenase|nr:SDR family NAD(P)-dependent oxidoreductase [Burkholderiaceae bacterium]